MITGTLDTNTPWFSLSGPYADPQTGTSLVGIDGPTTFPTVGSLMPVYKARVQAGLSRSYLGAAFVETPTHTEIPYETTDINTPQLAIRQAISPQVLQRWQLAQQLAAAQPIA